MAPHDPKYSSPPAGWLKCNACNINIADRAIMVMVAAQTRIRIGSWQVWKKGQPPGYLVRNCPSISLILDSSIANTELCHWRVFGWQSDRHMRSLWSSSGQRHRWTCKSAEQRRLHRYHWRLVLDMAQGLRLRNASGSFVQYLEVAVPVSVETGGVCGWAASEVSATIPCREGKIRSRSRRIGYSIIFDIVIPIARPPII